MIADTLFLLNSFNMPINFICHSLVFISSFYVAMHNREIPQWVITPLWYLGLTSLLISISILVQYFISPEHELSYWNLGSVLEYVSNIILSFMCVMFFSTTVFKDIKGAKKRKHAQLE